MPLEPSELVRLDTLVQELKIENQALANEIRDLRRIIESVESNNTIRTSIIDRQIGLDQAIGEHRSILEMMNPDTTVLVNRQFVFVRNVILIGTGIYFLFQALVI